MSWSALEAKTIDEAILELQAGGSREASTRGVLEPLNIWSIAGPGWQTASPIRSGGIILDILAPMREADGCDGYILHKCVGHLPNAFDVPDEVLIAHSYDFRETQDFEYAEWLAKVFYARSLMCGRMNFGTPADVDPFSVRFSEFKRQILTDITTSLDAKTAETLRNLKAFPCDEG